MTKEQVAAKVKKLREEKKWSQRDLAQHIGWGQERITRIEAGTWNVRLDSLVKIGKALDFEVILRTTKEKYSPDFDSNGSLIGVSLVK